MSATAVSCVRRRRRRASGKEAWEPRGVHPTPGELAISHELGVHRQVGGHPGNPAAVEGQIYGGVVQGIGWALYEGLFFDAQGQPASASLMEYVLPRSTMAPPIEVVLVEIPSEMGAYGAKGVGEPPAIPGPGAIANAIRDRTGARVTDLPMRAEVVARAIYAAEGGF